MDSALNKIGLYEFLSVFLSGAISIITGRFLKILPADIEGIENDILKIVLFLVVSYFVGIVLQEFSAWIDGKLFNFQGKVKSNFLSSQIINNPLELKEFQNIANRILNKGEDNTDFDESDNEYVFFYCKDFLEVNGKDGKAETLNSLCDMSRSLMTVFPIFILLYIFLTSPENISILNVLVLIFLTCVFYNRAKKYASIRARAIIRAYWVLTRSER